MFRKPDKYDLDRQLNIAIHHGKTDQIAKLIDKGADTEYRDLFSTYTVLMSAIINFNRDSETKYKIIDELLKNGANPNAGINARNLYINGIPMDAGATPLMLLLSSDPGCSKETKEIADLLLAHNADINHATDSVKNTVLHYANALKLHDWMVYLEEQGADKNIKNYSGLTPNKLHGLSVNIPWIEVPEYRKPNL